MAGTTTVAPFASAAATAAVASSTARYTDQPSGVPMSPLLRMHPATGTPPLVKFV
jgi:hypothetical protein